jgi:retinol dehydrogenase 14
MRISDASSLMPQICGRRMNMKGKIVVITGANSGIGFATAKGLAICGATVVLICRSVERGGIASKAVAEVATAAAPTLFIADLSSQAEIRDLSARLHEQLPRIDVLINNVGAAFAKRELTVDGLEKTFALNHLAPFLLTNLVLDLIRQSSAGRIVNLTAGIPGPANLLENLQGEKSYGQFAAYRSSKMGNILFTYELARRLDGTGITVNCVHPGPVKTEFTQKAGGVLRTMSILLRFIMKSPEAGARGPIYLASSDEVAGITGGYFVGRKQRRSTAMTYDRRLAAKHWEISEKLTGLRARAPEI